ncbi:MAG: nickel-dependent lactate racemase [Gemmatimonadota bacterium]|nr:MAG: nickel-dependent lactate racemase [Gemmatimonadota bacterium]
MREFRFPYGRKEVTFSLPEESVLGEIIPREVEGIADVESAIQEALISPFQSPALSKICKPGEKVAIVVSDITRPFPGPQVLPILLNELNRVGVPDEDITVVFALGGHRRHTKEEQKQVLGEEVARRVRYFDSFCEEQEDFVTIGTTSRGTKVDINKRVVEADRKILTGIISYHYYSGFTGGRKAVVPGISSFNTIQANHKLLLHPEPGAGHNPDACSGKLEGNPVHEDMVEACRMLKPDFLVNVVLSGHKNILRIFIGDPYAAHGEGCAFVESVFGYPIREKADLVLVSAGGFPKDINYYQAHKALDNAFYAANKEGVIILLAACEEGIGPESYMDWVRMNSPGEMESRLRDYFEVSGHNWYTTFLKTEQVRIILVSTVDQKVVEQLRFIPAQTVDEALGKAYELLKPDPSIYLMPQGYLTFPVFE